MRSPKNLIILFLALATVSCATIAWRQYQELIQLRAVVQYPPDLAVLRTRAAFAEQRAADLQAEIDATRNQPVAFAAPAAAAEIDGPDTPDAATSARRVQSRENMMDRPEMQRLIALQRKRALAARYSELFRSLNLPADQLEKLQNLLVDRSTARMDVMAAARSQGLNTRSDFNAVNQLVTQTEAEIDAGIRQTLGETGYAQYQEYERTLPQRGTVNQLEEQLSYTSTPLTREQSAALLSILSANSDSPDNASGRSSRRGFRSGQPTITDTIINQSLGVLAAPQISALRQLQQEQRAQEELHRSMRNHRPTAPAVLVPASGG